MHPLKLIKIKNPFGFLQTSLQILAEQVEPIFFIKNMFSWNTLIYIEHFNMLLQIHLMAVVTTCYNPPLLLRPYVKWLIATQTVSYSEDIYKQFEKLTITSHCEIANCKLAIRHLRTLRLQLECWCCYVSAPLSSLRHFSPQPTRNYWCTHPPTSGLTVVLMKLTI